MKAVKKRKNINENKEKEKTYFNEKFEFIREISNEEMNKLCFDCRKKDPKFISINNAIFLCEECAQIHKTFPDNISFIIDNNLNLLSNNFLKYLFYGGNTNLDNFINYDYPGLQNYAPEILYRTQAMIYYREELKCKIEGKPFPTSPNDVMAYKIVSENGLINIREGNKFLTKKISEDKIRNKDIINNYYNNYNNTYNTYNNFNYNTQPDNLNHNNNNNNISNITYKSTKINNNNNKDVKYCSLINTTFFNEMRNLFGKQAVFKNKQNLGNKSYKNKSKTKKKFQNYSLTNRFIDQPLTYRLNDSISYSITNRTNVNDPPSTNRALNKSNFSEDRIKSPKIYDYSLRYIKPLVKISHQSKYILNKLNQEKEKLKKKKLNIDLNKITCNYSINTLKNNAEDKVYKQKKKLFQFFKISKKIKKSNTTKNNLSFDKNKNKLNLTKNDLSDIINNNVKSYLYKNYISNINKKEKIKNHIKELENKTEIGYNKNYFNTIETAENININNFKNKDLSNKKLKNKIMNISSYNEPEERKPIKVNISLTYGKHCYNSYNMTKRKKDEEIKNDEEIKKKALKDKKEQEQLEQEALHNLLFENKDNDLFTNIIYMNNTEN